MADMLSRPPIAAFCLSIIMEIQASVHDNYVHLYADEPDFCDVVTMVLMEKPSKFILQGGLLYKELQLCVSGEVNHIQWILEAHTSNVACHFGVNKIV